MFSHHACRLLSLYLDKYIVKAGTAEGGAGAGSSGGPLKRLGALLKGRKVGAARAVSWSALDSLPSCWAGAAGARQAMGPCCIGLKGQVVWTKTVTLSWKRCIGMPFEERRGRGGGSRDQQERARLTFRARALELLCCL